MDGENKGKPYEQMDDLGENPHIFGNTFIVIVIIIIIIIYYYCYYYVWISSHVSFDHLGSMAW